MLVCLAAVPVGIFAKGEIKNQASETSNDIKSLEKLNSSELKINHETLDISLERSERLKVTNAEGQDVMVTWSSDQPEVASVSDTGEVYGKHEGTANITAIAENDGQKINCQVTVYGFIFQVNNGRATVFHYDGMGGNIIVPATFNGDPVHILSFTANGEPKLEQPIRSIVFSEGIEYVSSTAFYGMADLESVEFPLTFKGDSSGKVDLGNTKIKNLDGFKKVTQIRELDAYNNKQLTDISGIAGIAGLEVIGLSNASVSDISVLSKLTNLTRVGLNNTPISDVSPMSSLENLKEVSLGGTNVSDVHFFKNKGLKYLELAGSKVSDADRLSFVKVSNITYYLESDRYQEYSFYDRYPMGCCQSIRKDHHLMSYPLRWKIRVSSI